MLIILLVIGKQIHYEAESGLVVYLRMLLLYIINKYCFLCFLYYQVFM